MKSDKKILASIGRKIQNVRKVKGWSQEQLANFSKIDRSYIGAIERGERNVGILTLLKILDVLELTISDVLIEDNG